MLSVKNSLLFEIKKHNKYQICVMDLVSHQGITLVLLSRPKYQICVMDLVSHQGTTLILLSRSAIQLVCLFVVYLFVPFHLMA